MLVLSSCYNRHVNGTMQPTVEDCDGTWVAVVRNMTDRYYDLYVGTRLVGTAEPRSTSRVRLDPMLGRVTPTLRESATTRDQTGPRLSGGVRVVCE
jgi:hypothetical protein